MDELGRLFLGDVRRRQTEGQLPPKRRAPGSKPDVSIDLTPEEFARMFGDNAQPRGDAPALVQAVLAPHLNGRQGQCVRQYARHLAAEGSRVGLIELDGSRLQVSCFEQGGQTSEAAPLQITQMRPIVEALQEMNWDVNQWVLSIAHPRTPEARALLRGVGHWTLLATCDHDGVVGAYRTLKGLREDQRPEVTVAVLDALEPRQAGGIFDKLSSVCQQFLEWPLQHRIVVREDPQAGEQQVFTSEGSAIIWPAIEQFIGGLSAETEEEIDPAPQAPAATSPSRKQVVGEIVLPEPATPRVVEAEPLPVSVAQAPVAQAPVAPMTADPRPQEAKPLPATGSEDEVIDLPPGAAAGVLEAILRHQGQELTQSPLHPPMCPEACLAVGRDGRLTLAAAASAGLANLRAIAQAYHWLRENHALIRMALPQFAINADNEPQMRLFVDHSDLCAQSLAPLLQNPHVRIQPYRRVRWGEKAGLLLEAA